MRCIRSYFSRITNFFFLNLGDIFEREIKNMSLIWNNPTYLIHPISLVALQHNRYHSKASCIAWRSGIHSARLCQAIQSNLHFSWHIGLSLLCTMPFDSQNQCGLSRDPDPAAIPTPTSEVLKPSCLHAYLFCTSIIFNQSHLSTMKKKCHFDLK